MKRLRKLDSTTRLAERSEPLYSSFLPVLGSCSTSILLQAAESQHDRRPLVLAIHAEELRIPVLCS